MSATHQNPEADGQARDSAVRRQTEGSPASRSTTRNWSGSTVDSVPRGAARSSTIEESDYSFRSMPANASRNCEPKVTSLSRNSTWSMFAETNFDLYFPASLL